MVVRWINCRPWFQYGGGSVKLFPPDQGATHSEQYCTCNSVFPVVSTSWRAVSGNLMSMQELLPRSGETRPDQGRAKKLAGMDVDFRRLKTMVRMARRQKPCVTCQTELLRHPFGTDKIGRRNFRVSLMPKSVLQGSPRVFSIGLTIHSPAPTCKGAKSRYDISLV